MFGPLKPSALLKADMTPSLATLCLAFMRIRAGQSAASDRTAGRQGREDTAEGWGLEGHIVNMKLLEACFKKKTTTAFKV